MYKLMVSHDAGGTYFEQDRGEDLECLSDQGKLLDKELLRWVIEDEGGNIVAASRIHLEILAFMEKVNS